MKSTNPQVTKLVRETLEQKYTDAKMSWESMMEDLEKDIKKPVTLDDAGNYNVNDCEPHRISIRPVVHDIFNVLAYKDGSDRTKKLYVKYDDLKKFVKDFLASKDKNYVDAALSRNVENSKDKEGGKKADKQSEQENLVDPEKDNKVVKNIKAEPMNKEIDDPTQPMREIGKYEKQVDHKPKMPNYKPPVLPKKLQALVTKLKSRKGKGNKD